MKIRSYRSDDAEVVVSLWKDCGLVVSHNNPYRDIERKMKVNPEWFLVGEKDGGVVATCMVGYEGHRGWINYLAVSPTSQRNGLGKKLIAKAEALLREVGCPKMSLQIRRGNTDVIGFYEKLGFKEDLVVSMGKRLEEDEFVDR